MRQPVKSPWKICLAVGILITITMLKLYMDHGHEAKWEQEKVIVLAYPSLYYKIAADYFNKEFLRIKMMCSS